MDPVILKKTKVFLWLPTLVYVTGVGVRKVWLRRVDKYTYTHLLGTSQWYEMDEETWQRL